MLVGPTGSGKSLLCQMLAHYFRNTFRVVVLSHGGLTSRRALYRALLHGLGKKFRGLDETELRLALTDYLTKSDECRAGVLVIIDEAQSLSVRLLEELRVLCNATRDGSPCIRLIVSGNDAFEERLASPKIASFAQRVAARCYLETLGAVETQSYVWSVLRSAGGRAEMIFSEDSCDRVYRATEGVPRLINQLCDHSLVLAFADQQKTVSPACVDEAWADLQQLPLPETAESVEPSQPAAETIEYGSLDDEEPAPAESSLSFGSLDDIDGALTAVEEHLDAADAAIEPTPAPTSPVILLEEESANDARLAVRQMFTRLRRVR